MTTLQKQLLNMSDDIILHLIYFILEKGDFVFLRIYCLFTVLHLNKNELGKKKFFVDLKPMTYVSCTRKMVYKHKKIFAFSLILYKNIYGNIYVSSTMEPMCSLKSTLMQFLRLLMSKNESLTNHVAQILHDQHTSKDYLSAIFLTK